jgi:hypothetical protein
MVDSAREILVGPTNQSPTVSGILVGFDQGEPEIRHREKNSKSGTPAKFTAWMAIIL